MLSQKRKGKIPSVTVCSLQRLKQIQSRSDEPQRAPPQRLAVLLTEVDKAAQEIGRWHGVLESVQQGCHAWPTVLVSSVDSLGSWHSSRHQSITILAGTKGSHVKAR
jgi:hypothetical protein